MTDILIYFTPEKAILHHKIEAAGTGE